MSRDDIIDWLCDINVRADISIEEMADEIMENASQQQGEWKEIDIKDYKAICSCCGTWTPIMGNYCPNCGAEMRMNL